MLIFQYLDSLPKIPAELLVDPIVHDESLIGYQTGIYARWEAKPDLIQWLKTNISNYVNIAGIQIMTADTIPHCDRRHWAVNYLTDLGGSNVTTAFYQKENWPIVAPPSVRLPDYTGLKTLKQVVIEPGRWHILNTHILHGVTNVESQRQAVTIGLNSIDPFSELKCENI